MVCCVYAAVSLHRSERYECEYHEMFLNLVKGSSQYYEPAVNFLHDVLSWETGVLLNEVNVKDSANMVTLKRNFQQHIRDFIQTQNLSGKPVCECIRDFVVCAMWFCVMCTNNIQFCLRYVELCL